MKELRTYCILFAFSLVPYAAVAWAYMQLVNGEAGDFWRALAFLLVARLFFSVIEGLGKVLMWRLYGRRETISRHLAILRANKFPQRESGSDDFLDYISRIEDDDGLPAPVRKCAHEFRIGLMIYESMGAVAGMRMHSAADAALDIYSSKAEAPAQ